MNALLDHFARVRARLAGAPSWIPAHVRDALADPARGRPRRFRVVRPPPRTEADPPDRGPIAAPTVTRWDGFGPARFRRTLVTGGPGAGKSLLLRRRAAALAMAAADEIRAGAPDLRAPAPLLFSLFDVGVADRLPGDEAIVAAAAGPEAPPAAMTALREALDTGRCEVLIDDCDLALGPRFPARVAARRERLWARLQEFLLRHEDIRVIAAARHASAWAFGVPEFVEIELLELDARDAEAFAAAWFPADWIDTHRVMTSLRRPPVEERPELTPFLLAAACASLDCHDRAPAGLADACERVVALGAAGGDGATPALAAAAFDSMIAGSRLRGIEPVIHDWLAAKHLAGAIDRGGLERARILVEGAATPAAEVVDRCAEDPAARDAIVLAAALAADPVAVVEHLARPEGDDVARNRLAVAARALPEIRPLGQRLGAWLRRRRKHAVATNVARTVCAVLRACLAREIPFRHVARSLPHLIRATGSVPDAVLRRLRSKNGAQRALAWQMIARSGPPAMTREVVAAVENDLGNADVRPCVLWAVELLGRGMPGKSLAAAFGGLEKPGDAGACVQVIRAAAEVGISEEARALLPKLVEILCRRDDPAARAACDALATADPGDLAAVVAHLERRAADARDPAAGLARLGLMRLARREEPGPAAPRRVAAGRARKVIPAAAGALSAGSGVERTRVAIAIENGGRAAAGGAPGVVDALCGNLADPDPAVALATVRGLRALMPPRVPRVAVTRLVAIIDGGPREAASAAIDVIAGLDPASVDERALKAVAQLALRAESRQHAMRTCAASVLDGWMDRGLRVPRAARCRISRVPAADQRNPLRLVQRAKQLFDAEQWVAAAEAFRDLLGQPGLHPTDILCQLALSLKRAGEYAAAEVHYRQALARMRRDPATTVSGLSTQFNNLAVLEYVMGRFTEAERGYRRAVAVTSGPRASKTDLAHHLVNYAALLIARGDFEAAESCFRQATPCCRDNAGMTSATNEGAHLVLKYAMLLRHRGFPEDAGRLALSAAIYRLRANEGASYAEALLELAETRAARGMTTEALRAATMAWERRKHLLGAAHPETARAAAIVASCRLAAGDAEGAGELVAPAIDVQTEALGSRHPDVAVSLAVRGAVEIHAGLAVSARETLESVVSIRRDFMRPTHPVLGEALEALASAQALDGDLDAARLSAAEAAAIRDERLRRAGARPDVATLTIANSPSADDGTVC